jgi:hypothetical protein
MKLFASLSLLIADLAAVSVVAGHSVALEDTAAAAAAAANPVVERDLQQSCDITAAYHPDYSLPWSEGKCVLTTTCNSPSYVTELACCKEAYAGQTSNFCISQMANPPTSSPTKTGGPDAYYADYTLPWPEGKCINTVPVPSGRQIYSTQLACCKEAYAGQVSNMCVRDLATPPTTAPTKAGAAGTDYYPDYSLAWPEGKCINTQPIPSGRPTYTSQLACCKAAYGGQVSNACIKDLANPPTSAPTKVGGPDAFYADYSLPWPAGVCINTVPVPSGRPTYTTQLACCQAAYAGQVSLACTKKATATSAPTTAPYNVEVKITTDDYPGETSWTISAVFSGDGSPSDINSPTYEEASTDYSNKYLLDITNFCYSFVIVDSEGDGVCCTEGNGSFELFVDGVSVLSGGDFGDTTGAPFGNCPPE